MKRFAWLALPVSLAFAGCGVEDAQINDDIGAEVDDQEGKEDSVARPVGTFDAEAPGAGQFAKLVLKKDKTFHAEKVVYCVRAPCYPVVDEGTYKYTTSGGTRYIRFYATSGANLDRYAYEFKGDKLQLRTIGTTSWQTLLLADEAWCGTTADCSQQNLAAPACTGAWKCTSNVCEFKCSTGQNACEKAGGSCVAVYPGTCSTGTIGDATKYSCGGGLGVQCCLPKQNPCEAAGGSCVALTPSSCSKGTVGDANKYSCGGGLGVQCCLPAEACVPKCDAIGTRSEGWYDCSGQLMCWVKCSGETAKCDAIGSRSEGWYTKGKGCNSAGLIAWDNCSP